MTYRLDTDGSDLFTLSGAAVKPATIIDPQVLFHADFLGAKMLRFQANVIRTNGTFETNYAKAGYLYYQTTSFNFGKSFATAPMILVGGYCTYKAKWHTETYFMQFSSQQTNPYYWGAFEFYFTQQPNGSNTASSYSGVEVTSRDFNGNLYVYVMDQG